jgi:hypothetical protein
VAILVFSFKAPARKPFISAGF